MTLAAFDTESLARALSRWELAEYISAGLVTTGCIGEYISEFTNWFTDGVKERKERLAKRSTLLLIAALSLEVICLVRTNTLSGMLIGSLTDKAADAEAKAKSAVEKSTLAEAKATTAFGKADQADASASSALVLATGARREADSFAKDIASTKKMVDWRALTLEQRQRIRNEIAPFAGQEFTMVTYPDDPECVNLLEAVYAIAVAADWRYPTPRGAMLGFVEFGVTLRLSPSASDFAKHAAERLVSALKHEGIASQIAFAPEAAPNSIIGIRIGKKPVPMP